MTLQEWRDVRMKDWRPTREELDEAFDWAVHKTQLGNCQRAVVSESRYDRERLGNARKALVNAKIDFQFYQSMVERLWAEYGPDAT